VWHPIKIQIRIVRNISPTLIFVSSRGEPNVVVLAAAPRMENCERGKQEEDPQRNAEIHEEEHPS